MATGFGRQVRFVAAAALAALAAAWGSQARAAPYYFSTGNTDGLMATASRPSSAGVGGIESADDFVLTSATRLTGATFTGLLPLGFGLSGVGQVGVEIYRVFPKDSDTTRTPQVPTRANSPSDVAFGSRDSAGGTLTFSTTILAPEFTALNSVLDGIHASPSQTTGGDGHVTGMEVMFGITLTTPIDLAADHYFFVPFVQVSGGNFFWLSAPRPIAGGTGPFVPDLQTWIRNDALDPDWLRVGTDVVGAGAFNAAFTLTGETLDPAGTTVPAPATAALLAAGAAGFAAPRRRRRVRDARERTP